MSYGQQYPPYPQQQPPQQGPYGPPPQPAPVYGAPGPVPAARGPHAKGKNRPFVAMIMAIIALVCVLITWAGPLYKATDEVRMDMFGETQTTTGEMTFDYDNIEQSYRDCYGSDCSSGSRTVDYKDAKETEKMVNAFQYLNIIGIIMAILVIALAPVARFVPMLSPKLVAIFALIGFIMCLLAPIIFAAGIPKAIEKDATKNDEKEMYCGTGGGDSPCKTFMGTDSSNDPYGTGAIDGYKQTRTWGPDMAWFMPLIAMVFMIIAMALLFASPRATPGAFGQPYGYAPYAPAPAPAYGYQQAPAPPPPAQYPPAYQQGYGGPQPPPQPGYGPGPQPSSFCVRCGTQHSYPTCPNCGTPRL